jgi:hypothetical protein
MEDFNELNLENLDEVPKQPKPMGMFGMLFSSMTTDMKFIGMFYIIYGVFTSLSIIGAVIGIPLLISGLRIREAADELNTFRVTNDSSALRRGFELQGKFFRIQKIIIIVGLVIAALYIIAIFFFLGSVFSSGY